MKILFTFERSDLLTRATEWYNFLSFLGHEVYLYNPTQYDIDVFKVYNTQIKYVYDINFASQCHYWFYDVTPFNWGEKPKTTNQLKSFKGKLFCINYEDGYSFFEWLLDQEIIDKTSLFIGNALFSNRDRYEQFFSIKDKVFLTTSYITNSQPFGNVPIIPISQREKRIYFSGALTGFPSSLTDMSDSEYKLRYNLVKKVIDSGIDHIVRFTGCDPKLQELYEEIPSELKSSPIDHRAYVSEFISSFICLSIKGNSFPTNRLYESQAAGCVTFTNKLHCDADFYGTGDAGKGYVEINVDGSDIVDLFHYYTNNPTESQKISENARSNWETYTRLDSKGVWPKKTYDYHLNGIRDLTGIDLAVI